jgi:hypothetical protein
MFASDSLAERKGGESMKTDAGAISSLLAQPILVQPEFIDLTGSLVGGHLLSHVYGLTVQSHVYSMAIQNQSAGGWLGLPEKTWQANLHMTFSELRMAVVVLQTRIDTNGDSLIEAEWKWGLGNIPYLRIRLNLGALYNSLAEKKGKGL